METQATCSYDNEYATKGNKMLQLLIYMLYSQIKNRQKKNEGVTALDSSLYEKNCGTLLLCVI